MPEPIPKTAKRKTTRPVVSPAERAEAGQELSREKIVAAAIAIADREGLAGVSIRRVAARFKTSPMALYYYVPTKHDLLSFMLDAVHGETVLGSRSHHGWRDFLTYIAEETRRSLVLHPWLPAARATEPKHGHEYARVLESTLITLNGFSIDSTLGLRILGALFAVANAFGTRAAGPALPEIHQEILRTGQFPHVAALVTQMGEGDATDRFHEAIGWILDGVEKQLHKGQDPPQEQTRASNIVPSPRAKGPRGAKPVRRGLHA